MFTGAALALRSSLSWWTVPLALICGWAFSQAVSYIGFSRDAWGEPPGAAVVWALLAALISTAALGLAGDSLLGGRFSGVVFAAASCGFMTAAAELVVHGEERMIGALLLPGAIGSLVFVTRVPFALPVVATVALSAVSVAATVLAALRHLPARWWRRPVLSPADLPTAVRYFATGLVLWFLCWPVHCAGARQGWPAQLAGRGRLPNDPFPRGDGVAAPLVARRRLGRLVQGQHRPPVHERGSKKARPFDLFLPGRPERYDRGRYKSWLISEALWSRRHCWLPGHAWLSLSSSHWWCRPAAAWSSCCEHGSRVSPRSECGRCWPGSSTRPGGSPMPILRSS